MQSDLKTLEYLLQLPLFDSGIRPNAKKTAELLDFIQSRHEVGEFGIFVRIETHSAIIKKMISLLIASLQLRRLSNILNRQGNIIAGRLGVYPDIDDPVTIYQLDSFAEQYVNRFVLPVFPRSINGRLRKLIMKLVKFHPSTAGLIIVASKG